MSPVSIVKRYGLPVAVVWAVVSAVNLWTSWPVIAATWQLQSTLWHKAFQVWGGIL